MLVLTLEQVHELMRAQGVPIPTHVAFKCPATGCGTVQSMQDFINAGVDKADAEKLVGFSCVGRYAPGQMGCDWTLGGFLKIHKLEVTTGDGMVHPSFELATPEEAQAHYFEFAPPPAPPETPTPEEPTDG